MLINIAIELKLTHRFLNFRYKLNPSETCGCCCSLVDSMNCCNSQISYQYPTTTTTHPLTVDNTYNPRLYGDAEASIDFFPSQKFYSKRAARLAPVYYLTNLLAMPLTFLYVGVGFFVYTFIVSLFLISSWLIVGPMNGVLWTISTMAFFYCMFPHLIVRLQRMHTAVDFR
jgi:hypothetical protein